MHALADVEFINALVDRNTWCLPYSVSILGLLAYTPRFFSVVLMRILLTLATVLLPGVLFSAERPNILWLSWEDIGPHLGWTVIILSGRRISTALPNNRLGLIMPPWSPRSALRVVVNHHGHVSDSIGTNHYVLRNLPEFVRPFSIDSGNPVIARTIAKRIISSWNLSATWDESSGRPIMSSNPFDQPFWSSIIPEHTSSAFNERSIALPQRVLNLVTEMQSPIACLLTIRTRL